MISKDEILNHVESIDKSIILNRGIIETKRGSKILSIRTKKENVSFVLKRLLSTKPNKYVVGWDGYSAILKLIYFANNYDDRRI